MNGSVPDADQKSSGGGGTSPTIMIQQSNAPSRLRVWVTRLIVTALIISVLANMRMLARYENYFADGSVSEKYDSGEKLAEDKIAILRLAGTIMPPFTGRMLKSIDQVKKDDAVKGVLLVVDSPGGLVADSHQIYHRLKQLAEKKPVYVAMERMAASGGLYIAMGAGQAGKIFAEPTTWTGSIGVIIPRYDVSKLALKWDIKADPLKTGPFKDSLSPFREISDAERVVWDAIMDDAFSRFLNVIAENREPLDQDAVRKLATGQIYTADQAKANGLIDEIGYRDDALEALKGHLGLEKVRVVSYQFQPALMDLLTGSATTRTPEQQWRSLMEMTVPRAMYFCSWAPGPL